MDLRLYSVVLFVLCPFVNSFGPDGEFCIRDDDCLNDGVCVPDEAFFKVCKCPPPYVGPLCEAVADNPIPDEDPFCYGEQKGYCRNQGTCQKTADEGYKCQCPPGWSGRICTESNDCSTKERSWCFNNGECKQQGLIHKCVCRPGFTGKQCEVLTKSASYDLCKTNPCNKGSTCKNILEKGVVADYTCICRTGFSGKDCEQKIGGVLRGSNKVSAVHKCVNMSPSCVNGECVKVLGVDICQCRHGWTGEHCSRKCASGSYGAECSTKCHNCADRQCDHVTGKCLGECQAGWRGVKCDQVDQVSVKVEFRVDGNFRRSLLIHTSEDYITASNHVSNFLTTWTADVFNRASVTVTNINFRPGSVVVQCELHVPTSTANKVNLQQGVLKAIKDRTGQFTLGLDGPYRLDPDSVIVSRGRTVIGKNELAARKEAADKKSKNLAIGLSVGGVYMALAVMVLALVVRWTRNKRKQAAQVEAPAEETAPAAGDAETEGETDEQKAAVSHVSVQNMQSSTHPPQTDV